MFGLVGEVGELHWVGVYVEEHGSVGCVGAELGVAKLFGPGGGSLGGGGGFAPGAEGGLGAVGAGVVEERSETGAFDLLGSLKIAELGYRAIDIERLRN